MNWYRIAQKSNTGITYHDVGHEGYYSGESKCQEYIWYWDGKQVQSILLDFDKLMDNHNTLFGDAVMNKIKGRAQICPNGKKDVSLSLMPAKMTDVPSVLYRALEREFGADIQIHEFR